MIQQQTPAHELMKEAEAILKLLNEAEIANEHDDWASYNAQVESLARSLAERDARLLEEAASAIDEAECWGDCCELLRSRAAAIRNGLSTTKQEG